MPISQRFLYLQKKTNNIFLKFHHSLFGMPEIIEIGWILHSEKAQIKKKNKKNWNSEKTLTVFPPILGWKYSCIILNCI